MPTPIPPIESGSTNFFRDSLTGGGTIYTAKPDAVGLAALPAPAFEFMEQYKTALEGFVSETVAATIVNVIGGLIHATLGAAEATGFAVGHLNNAKTRGETEANRSFPAAMLDIDTIVNLLNSDRMAPGNARQEAGGLGLDESRLSMTAEAAKELLGIPDALHLLRIGEITKADFDLCLQWHGVHKGFRPFFEKLTRQFLDVTPIVQSWLRNDITESDFMGKLGQLGYNQADKDIVKKLAFFIPPVADLVRMAVRDVFTPALVQSLDLDAEFPAPFEELAKKQGVSSDFAHKYWQAHWELPSPSQAFDMFHRDVITKEVLQNLLKAQDYAPTWRDKLLAISYNTITRVDVRRMYEMGIIDGEEVARQYRYSGYSPENAERLRKFVEADVFESTISPVRARILNLFRKGIVDEQELHSFLTDLKMPEDRIVRFIAAEKMLAEEEHNERQMNSFKKQYLASRITAIEAGIRLAALGLSAMSVATTLENWVEEKKSRITRLSSMDIHKANKKNLISDKEAEKLLVDRNMSPAEIKIFLALDAPEPEEV